MHIFWQNEFIPQCIWISIPSRYWQKVSDLVVKMPDLLRWRSWVQTPDPKLKNFQNKLHQQKLRSLSIAYDIKLEGALCSVFYAGTSTRPWTFLNLIGYCQTPSLVINNLIWRSPTLEDATALKLSQPLYKGCPVLYAMEGSPQITCATHGYVTLEYVQGIYSM